MRYAGLLAVMAVAVLTVASLADDTSAIGAHRAANAFTVEPMSPGRTLDELRVDAVGRRCPDPQCTGSGAACPQGAAVWASGTFVDDLSPAALAHGDLTLQLSLCCNFTFRRDFLPPSAVAAAQQSTYRRSDRRNAAPTASMDEDEDAMAARRLKFARFLAVLVSRLPARVQDVALQIFDADSIVAHASLRSIQLRTKPLPARLATEVSGLLRQTPTAAVTDGFDADPSSTESGRGEHVPARPPTHLPGAADEADEDELLDLAALSGEAMANDGAALEHIDVFRRLIDGDGWILHVANFVLDCKCPRTLRAAPVMLGRGERAPAGLVLEGGGTVCLDPVTAAKDTAQESNDDAEFDALLDDDEAGSEDGGATPASSAPNAAAPRPFQPAPVELRLRAEDPQQSGATTTAAIALKPYAVVTWTVAPEARPNEATTVVSRVGIRLLNLPRNEKFRVTVRAAHGAASVTMTAHVGWAIQPHFRFDSVAYGHPSVAIGKQALLPVHANIEGVDLTDGNATCANLPWDSSTRVEPKPTTEAGCAAAWHAMLQKRMNCNVPFDVPPPTATGDQHRFDLAAFTALRPGDNRITCAIRDPIQACPFAGNRIVVHSVQIVSTGDPERVVCTANTSLTAAVKGIPRELDYDEATHPSVAAPHAPADSAENGTESTSAAIGPYFVFGWTCQDPSDDAALVASPEYGKQTVVVAVPATGLTCRFTVTATPRLIASPHLLPTSPHEATAVVRIASRRADFQSKAIDPVNFTTKSMHVLIAAPTAAGRWRGNDLIDVVDALEAPGRVANLPIREAVATMIRWVNSVRPCVGHEMSVPVNVAWAPPVAVAICGRSSNTTQSWYEGNCATLQSSGPAPDEQGRFGFDNGTGRVVATATLDVLGPKSAKVCDAPAGAMTPVRFTVENPAGALFATCIARRCTTVPQPTFPAVMSTRRVVFGPVLVVEANEDYDTETFVGTWTASDPAVTFDDPHAPRTIARHLPAGTNTTVVFELDTIAERERPAGLCAPKRAVLAVTSEAADCPVGPLRTCTSTAEAPYVTLANAADRERSAGSAIDIASFSVACSESSVTALITDEGALRVSGLEPGMWLTCTVTAAPKKAQSGIAADELRATHCIVQVERVMPVVAQRIISRRFWVGDGSVPVAFEADVMGRTSAPVGERRPRLLTVGNLHVSARTISGLKERANVTIPVELALANATELLKQYLAANTTTAMVRGSALVPVVADTDVRVTFELVDELCGATNVSARIWALQAQVAAPVVVTCDSMAPLVGLGLPAWMNNYTDEVAVDWSLSGVVLGRPVDPSELNPALWVTRPSPFVHLPTHPVSSAGGLPYGNTTATFTLSLRDTPEQRSTASLVIIAASRNIPPHLGHLYTTLSQVTVPLAKHDRRVAIRPAIGFHPKRNPALTLSDDGEAARLVYLFRGKYDLSYLPNPVEMPVRACPPALHRNQRGRIERLALRVAIGWERDVSECDVLRGTASLVVTLLAAHPDGTYTRPPPGIELALSGATLRRVLRELNPPAIAGTGTTAQASSGQWWLERHVNWTASALSQADADAFLATQNVTIRNDTDAELRGRLTAVDLAASGSYSGNVTAIDSPFGISGVQAIRVRIQSDHFFRPEELTAPVFGRLRVPAMAVKGLAESTDPELRVSTSIRVLQLNGSVVEPLVALRRHTRTVSDEDVATGRQMLGLKLKRVPRAAAGPPSTPISGILHRDSSAHCNRSLPATSNIGGWFHAAPQSLRNIPTACFIDRGDSSVDLQLRAGQTFVLPPAGSDRHGASGDATLPLMAPKLALCGLDAPMPRLPTRADQLNPAAYVDFGSLIVTKTPLSVTQSRDTLKQCILAASVPPVAGAVRGGYVADAFVPESVLRDEMPLVPANNIVAPTSEGRTVNMSVLRADGRSNEVDRTLRGPESAARCIHDLSPTVTVVDRKHVTLRLHPCPLLQLGTGANANLSLILTSTSPMLVDGNPSGTLQPLQLHLRVIGSRAIVTPLLRTVPAPALETVMAGDVAIEAHRAAPDADSVVPVPTTAADTEEVRFISEADLKSGRLVLRIQLEGDSWHPDVGTRTASGFNTAMANGFGLPEADDDPVREAQRQVLQKRWFSHLVGLPALARYADALLRPAHVVRINDTAIDLLVPGCAAAPARLCRRLALAAEGSMAEEPVPYFVPGLATECPGCLRAVPALRVVPSLGGVSVLVPDASSSARLSLQSWMTLDPYAAVPLLPSTIALDSTRHAWSTASNTTGKAAPVHVRAVTRDNVVRATYTPLGANGISGRRMVLVRDEDERPPNASSNATLTDDEDRTVRAADNLRRHVFDEPLLFVVAASHAAFDAPGTSGAAAASTPGPILQQLPFAVSTAPPPEVVWPRILVALAHGYLVFMAVEAIRLASGRTSEKLLHYGRSSTAARACGALGFAVALALPPLSTLSLLLFVAGWMACILARGGLSWLTVELLGAHAALLWFAGTALVA